MQQEDEATNKQNRDYIRAYFLLSNFAKVVEYANGLKPENLKDAWACYRIGDSYYNLQQPDKALPWYKRATDIWPYSLDFQNKYGTCLLALGKQADAQKVFSFIYSENPDYLTANTNLGYLYLQQGNMTMAYSHLLRAAMLNPDHEQTLINLAVVYHANAEDSKAKKALLHLLKKHPANQQARAMLMDLQ
jgi:tetratricopeptide (TPR) repeat protein